jgi:Predicted transmembrane protein 161AB
MQLITGEFLILAVLIFISTQVRVRYNLIESILRNLVVFFPPEKPSEEKKISYTQIEDKFSSKSPNFDDTELLVILMYLTLGVNLVSGLVQINPWVNIGISISFYLIIFTGAYCIYGLFKQSIKSGLSSAENLLSLLYSLILFFLFSIILLSNHESYLDFNFNLSVELLELQLTSTLKPYLQKNVTLDYFTICLIISLFAAVSVYPMFKYINRFVSTFIDANPVISKKIYGVLIISPLLLSILWIKPMVKDLLPKSDAVETYFNWARVSGVIFICILKLYHIRAEIQSLLNFSSKMVQETLLHPSKENLDLCMKKCRGLATIAWPITYQSISCTCYIIILVLLLATKGGLGAYPRPTTQSILIENYLDDYDDDEFIATPNQSIQRYINVTEVPEVTRLKVIIQAIKANEKKDIIENIAEISKITLLHPLFFRDLCEFLIWSTYLSWSLATVMSFVLINIGSSKVKSS